MTARPALYIGASLARYIGVSLVCAVSGATLYDKHRDKHWDKHWDVWAVGSQR